MLCEASGEIIKVNFFLYVGYKGCQLPDQYLHPSCYHLYHCVKSIPDSQALQLNRICLNNIFFWQPL